MRAFNTTRDFLWWCWRCIISTASVSLEHLESLPYCESLLLKYAIIHLSLPSSPWRSLMWWPQPFFFLFLLLSLRLGLSLNLHRVVFQSTDSAHFHHLYPICPVLTSSQQRQGCAWVAHANTHTPSFLTLMSHHLCLLPSALMLPQKKPVISAQADGNVYSTTSFLLLLPCVTSHSPTVNSLNDVSTPCKEPVIKVKSPPL